MNEEILKLIYIKAKNTKDDFIKEIDLGVKGQERNNICNYLQKNGYISRTQYIGKSKVQCQVKQKTFKLFEDIEKNKTDENNKEDSIKSVTEYIILLAKQSYECEEKREESMISHSTRLIEVLSFLMAGIGVAISPILEYVNRIPKKFIFIVLSVVLVMIMISFVLLIIAQWRYSYQTFPLPNVIYDNIRNDFDNYKKKEVQCDNYINLLNDIQKCKKENNDKRGNYIKMASKLLLISIAIIIISGIIAFIKYFL